MADEVDELFDLPPGEFTKGRNELAARLKKSGRADDSNHVKSLRKPSLSAWATNQLTRQRGEHMTRLLEISDSLRRAQQDVLGGADAASLRDATRQRRALVSELVEEAARLLENEGAGSSRTQLDRVTNNLMAAATDEGARDALAEGRLTADLAPGDDAGFGVGFDAFTSSMKSRTESPAEAKASERAEIRRRAEDLARAADKAEMRAHTLAQDAEAATRTAERTARAAEAAAQEAEKARARADAALAEIEP
jgi:hypothetical protein